MIPRLTNHANERGRERLGLHRAALERTAEIALRDGIAREDAAGSLRRYLDKLVITHRKGNNLRIYGHSTYVFQDNVLVTVLHLPREYHGTVDKLARAKRTPAP